jgi:hypothetical protein
MRTVPINIIIHQIAEHNFCREAFDLDCLFAQATWIHKWFI